MAEIQNNEMNTQELSELLKIRRDKLSELQNAGEDPFVITKYERSNHTVDIINDYENFEDKQVSLA